MNDEREPLPRRPGAIVRIAIVALALWLLRTPLGSDVSWQLWIAGRLRHGAVLYRDILEVNPPLWFWLAVPVDALAEALAVRPEPVLVLAFAAATLASLEATHRLLAPLTEEARTGFLLMAALALLALPRFDFGQREQIALIAALPWAMLAAARRQGDAVPRMLAIGIGIGSAIGFALKPHFLLAPLLVELWLIVALRRDWRPRWPETIALAATGLLYAAALAILAPLYFTTMLPMVRVAYGAVGDLDPIPMMRLLQWLWVASLAIVLLPPRRLLDPAAGLSSALAAAGTGFAIAYLVQGKGWNYHAIAASGCFALAMGALFIALKRTGPAGLRLAAGALAVLPILLAIAAGPYDDARQRWSEAAVAGVPKGASVAFLTSEPAFAWPLVQRQGLDYASRYYGFWMLPAIVVAEGRGRDPRLAALGRRIAAETARDLACRPPARLIADRLPDAGIEAGQHFDILRFFARDANFARIFSRYRRIGRAGPLEIYAPVQRIPPRCADDFRG